MKCNANQLTGFCKMATCSRLLESIETNRNSGTKWTEKIPTWSYLILVKKINKSMYICDLK